MTTQRGVEPGMVWGRNGRSATLEGVATKRGEWIGDAAIASNLFRRGYRVT
jgi:hypothetical protein